MIFYLIFVFNSLKSNCKYYIKEHYFDISGLSSTTDYSVSYSTDNTLKYFEFNFCQYI